MVYSLKLYLASSVLFSIGIYIYLGFRNIHTQAKDFRDYLKKIISSSIFITFFSILYIVRAMLLDYNNNSKLIFYGVLAIQAVFFIFIIIILKSNQDKDFYKSKQLKILIAILSISFIFTFLIDNPLLVYRVSLGFYLVSNVNLFRVALSKKYKEHIVGIFYMLLSFITVILVNAMYSDFNINLILIITVSLQIFTLIGMMLFYSSYHLKQIDDSKVNLEVKNTELKQLYLQLKETVYVDNITGLPNKNSFLDSFKLRHTYKMVALINIKNFKHINQLVGFDRANDFLNEIAIALNAKICNSSNLYRYDADQFLIVSENDLNDFKRVFQDFRSTDLIIDNFHIDFYCSIIEFQIQNDMLELLNMLEVGLNNAKLDKSRIYSIDAEDYSSSKETMALTLKLKKAINENCFEIYYQPKYFMKDESIASYEALIRWFDGNKFISPGIFIPIAEEEDLIDEISRIVVHKVFDTMRLKWHKNRCISINLSVLQLMDDNFIDFIIDTATLYAIDPHEIILEVTETMLQGNLKLVQGSISRLKDVGFKLSLDDFGSGASSLYRFAKLDFDEVKFDRSFVTDMALDEKVFTTFKKTVELFKAYNMTIVAEGIETKEQLDLLRSMDIDQIQGFYYSKPLPFEEVINL